MRDILDLPADLPAVLSVVGSDPDGEIERQVAALLLGGEAVAAAALALTIANPYRRDAWLRQFRPATLAAARAPMITEITPLDCARVRRHEMPALESVESAKPRRSTAPGRGT